MLKISLDLVPFGDSDRTRNLGEMVIGNVGKNEDGTDAYIVILDGEEIGHVQSFDRSRGPWDLLKKAIDILSAERRIGLNPPKRV